MTTKRELESRVQSFSQTIKRIDREIELLVINGEDIRPALLNLHGHYMALKLIDASRLAMM